LKILYFAPIDWGYIRQRPQHLAQRLAKYFDFTYVQPLGLRNPKPSDFNRAIKRFFVFFKTQNSNDGLIIKNPIFLPIINPSINRINQHLLKKQLQPLTNNDTVVWVTSPSKLMPHLLEQLKFKILVYEMMDDYAEIHAPIKKDIIETEKWLGRNASLIITTSTALFEKAKMFNKRTVLIGNGVDFDFFNKSRFTRPTDLQGMRRIAGYIGSIDKWVDFKTVTFLADCRKDIDFVFVGPIKIRHLPMRDNLKFLGQKNYTILPHYCNQFDVCLIPFTPNKFADTINPTKLYEYFALGKPVVTYRMKELMPYSQLIFTATDQLDFLNRLEQAFSERSFDIKLKRKEVAKINDWSSKAESLRAVLSQL